MREYTITKIDGAPNWDLIPSLPIDNLLWTEPVDITAEAKIGYDENALHVCLRAKEAHIRAEHTGLVGMPCEDSCLEFFFSPDPEDLRYINIEFNPNAAMYLGTGTGIQNLLRIVPEEPCFQPEVTRFDGGWQIVYQVPYSFIRQIFPGFSPVSGGKIRANCYKCGDLTPHPHFLAWNPVTSETPAFHRPQDFGVMYFG